MLEARSKYPVRSLLFIFGVEHDCSPFWRVSDVLFDLCFSSSSYCFVGNGLESYWQTH